MNGTLMFNTVQISQIIFVGCHTMVVPYKVHSHWLICFLIHPIHENTWENVRKISLFSCQPLFGKLQLCDICLDKFCVSKVTVLFLVFFHKVLHKVHSCHMMCFANEMTCVSSGTIKGHIFIKTAGQLLQQLNNHYHDYGRLLMLLLVFLKAISA